MPVPASISDLTAVAATNSPQGTETVKGTIDDYFRAHASFIKQTYDQLLGPTVVLASAATVNIGFAASQNVGITGTTTITAFDTYAEGTLRWVVFAGALTLTHNAVSLIMPASASLVTAAGDVALFKSLGGGNWKCMDYQRLNGQGVVACLPMAGGEMSGNIVLNNNISISAKTTGGTARSIAYVDTGNILHMSNVGGIATRFDNSAGGEIGRLTEAGVLSLTNTFSVDGSALNQGQLAILKNTGAAGAQISLQGNGATTPNKTLRLLSGVLEVVNNAYTSVIMSLSDAGVLSAPTITQTSDQRKKKNWAPLTDEQLDALADIKLSGTFDWKNGDGRSVGGSAQAIQRIVPEAVHADAKGSLTVNYGGLCFAIEQANLRRQKKFWAKVERRLTKLEAK